MRLLALVIAALLISPLAYAKHKKARAPEYDLQTELAKTTAPADGDTCFSPDEHCDAKLIKFVQGAALSLDIAIYDINHEQLVHQILLQSKKLKVRVLVDQRQAKGPKSLVSLLTKAGADVRYGRQRGIMHNKFVVLDGKMIETGSFNYTHHASLANNENQIYLSNPRVVKRFKQRFEEIWSKGKPAATPGARALSSE